MGFYQLADLKKDMRCNQQSIEQFYVTYNNIKFDVIFDIGVIPYELLIGAVNHSWACTLKINRGYEINMSDNDFYALCKLLNLKPGRESLTSFKFIFFIVEHAPHKCSNKPVEPKHLVPFRAKKISAEDEPDKVVFRGWNDHKKDGKQLETLTRLNFY